MSSSTNYPKTLPAVPGQPKIRGGLTRPSQTKYRFLILQIALGASAIGITVFSDAPGRG